MDVTSSLGLLIASATLIVVLIQERRYRRRVAPAIWDTTAFGTTTNNATSQTHHVIKIEQNGSDMVNLLGIWAFGCTFHLTNEYRLKRSTFRPGDAVELLVEADNIEEAWMLIQWMSLEDRTRGAAEWMPLVLNFTSPLAEKYWEQRQQELAKSRWQRAKWRDSYMLRRVGPDHYLHRRTPTSSRKHKRLGQMASGVLKEDIQGSTGALQ